MNKKEIKMADLTAISKCRTWWRRKPFFIG